MKDKEKEQLKEMYEHYGYRCIICGEMALHRAHCLSNTRLNRRLYGDAVIDHPANFYPVCNLDHNKRVDIGSIPLRQQEIANIIESDCTESEKRELIESIIRRKNGIST